jgi:hypothetical protein
MLVFATSDKGGTGRTVTSSNLVYRCALQGSNVAYLDFDFGSPTAGAVFGISDAMRGTRHGGLHSYIKGSEPEPQRLDVWNESERESLRSMPRGAGELILLPGDENGSEFAITAAEVDKCAALLLRLHQEFELTLMDLSAGRSYATDLVLKVTALPEFKNIESRWLIFHRWTRQHVLAAAGLALGTGGILDLGVRLGHDKEVLKAGLRFVRTAVVDPASAELAGLTAAQVAWLHEQNRTLTELARSLGIGLVSTIGTIPLDPVLQWREQLITQADATTRHIANSATVDAFDDLAKKLMEGWITY